MTGRAGPGIRVPERLQRSGLPFGQVSGVLEHGVSDAAHRLGRRLVVAAPGLVPQPFAHPVERVAHPGDDVERVQDAPGVRQALLHAGVDPLGTVAGDDPYGGALLVGRLSEEQAGHLLAVSVVRPDDPFALVVDDHGDVRVPLPAAGPVHAYRGETVEHARHRGFQAGGDPARDMAGRPPRDAPRTPRTVPSPLVLSPIADVRIIQCHNCMPYSKTTAVPCGG